MSEAVAQKLTQTLEALEAGGVPHAYWKASRRLPEVLEGGSDYDLLVPSGCGGAWMEIFAGEGFSKFRAPAGQELVQMAHLVALAPGTDELVHIHVHEAAISGDYGVWEYELGRAEDILAHRVLDPELGVYRLSPEMEVTLLALRAFTEPKMRDSKTGLLTARAVADLRHAWEHVGPEFESVAGAFLTPEVARELVALLESRSFYQLTQLAGLMTPLLPRFERISAPQRLAAQTRRRAKGLTQAAHRRLRPRAPTLFSQAKGLRAPEQGLFVAVVGPDGAGKSTLVDHLESWLAQTLAPRRVYLGKGNVVSTAWHGLARLKWRVIGLTTGATPLDPSPTGDGEDAPSESVESSYDAVRTPGRQRLWELSRAAQAARQWRKVQQARWDRARGRVVITDRLPHSHERFADGPTILVGEQDPLWTKWTSATERAFMGQIARRNPDIVIRLSISAQDAWDRKPEHNFDDIRRKVEALEAAAYPGAKVHVIDAMQPLEVVQHQARVIVWKAMTARLS